MFVPKPAPTPPAPRPRPHRGIALLLIVLLVLLAESGAVMLTPTARRPSFVALQRRSQWRGALVEAPRASTPSHTVSAHTDQERLVLAAAHAFGITDTLALAVMEQESGGDPAVVSPAGARGLLQVMPATGADIAAALRVAGYTPAMLDDPALNARFGMYYLQQQIRRFGLAWGLAAYNWGPNGVGDFLATVPAARTMGWDAVCQQYGGAIPAETQHYVRNILAIQARLAHARAAVATEVQAAPTTLSVGPRSRTQGVVTLTIPSVTRVTATVTLASRLDTTDPARTVTPALLPPEAG